MKYQKLFNIVFNNKRFCIFIDQYGRRTFLEIDNSSRYSYPLLSDFIMLNKIYNERDLFISYERHRLPIHGKPQSIQFKEFVKNYIGSTALILASISVASLYTSLTMGVGFKLEKQNDQIKVVVDYIDAALIENTNELDKILGYENVTLEEVINVINTNENIDDAYKQYAISLATFLKNKYPETDQRIFYENVKDMKITIEEKQRKNKHYAGTYNSKQNEVTFREDHKEDECTIIHEFSHSYHHWIEQTMLTPKIRVESQGHSLDEAMNNKIISGLVNPKSYYQEKKTLEYFLTCVDYNYYDYEREGITKLITLLKEKYPELDIDYIINSLDAINDTNTNTDNYIKIEETPELLDQIFNMCIYNIDMDSKDIYQPFINFMKLIEFDKYKELAEQYLEEYNQVLLEKGYDKDKLEKDTENFAHMIKEFQSYRKNFREYVDSLDINEIPKDNIYVIYKSYLQDGGTPYRHYNSDEELHTLFFDLLEIYNDFLYRNGYTKEETITKQQMQQKLNRYKGISVIAGAITDEDILLPIVDIPNIDKIYNINTKTPVMTKDGKIMLLDSDTIKTIYVPQENICQYNFIKGIFASLEEQPQIDEKFWQEQFDLDALEYKKIGFTLNGEIIAEDYINDVNITIGQRMDGSNTFSLSSTAQSIVRDTQTINEQTMPLTKYIATYLLQNEEIKSIELDEYLTEDYLKHLIAGENLTSSINQRFATFTYDKKKDVVNVHPAYYVTIDDKKMPMNEVILDLIPEHAYLWVDGYLEGVSSKINTNVNEEYNIFLETVLDYYGIISEEKTDYTFSKDEVLQLYDKYSEEVCTNDNIQIISQQNRSQKAK